MQADFGMNQNTIGWTVQRFVKDFFEAYYIGRDYQKVMDYFDDDIIFIGLNAAEIVQSKDACSEIVKKQMDDVKTEIPYILREYKQALTANGSWNCYAAIDLNVVSEDWGFVRYNIRITLVVNDINENLKISLVHVSEVHTSESVNEAKKVCPVLKNVEEQELGRIMSQVIPGGIVSKYPEEGSPISIVNEELLKMLKYPSFYDLIESCDGYFENMLHPDDVMRYEEATKFVLENHKQCECKYRLKCSDNRYIWVHDTSRTAASLNGPCLIVSLLTDASIQVEQQKILETESYKDALTFIYNRRGGEKKIAQLCEYKIYTFLLVDVDNFKAINDLYGHKTGDQVLKDIAGLLETQFGKSGIVYRLGGDEFGIFIPDQESVDYIETAVKKVMNILKLRFNLICPEAQASLSVGGVCDTYPFKQIDAFDKADLNMYKVKKEAKNGLLITKFNDQ